MIASFLITFREVIEATVIVATITAILVKLDQRKSIRTVTHASLLAIVISVVLLVGGSMLGYNMQKVYTGKTEELIEGIFMILSSIFITWAVFFLHTYFSDHKTHLMKKVKESIEQQEQRGLFLLVFLAVFREGFEIVLFLSSMYLSSNPQEILTGFMGGLIIGLLVSYALFKSTLSLSIQHAFKVSTILLLLFSAGLLARGIHEFAEAGLIGEYMVVIIPLIPEKGTVIADFLKAMFGITKKMDILQIGAYFTYLVGMGFYLKRSKHSV